MKIHDLEIVIENIRGSYKKFVDSLDEYPVLGVTFPTHYGYIDGYLGEDGLGLDVFLGNGNLLGHIRFYRDDAEGGIETKMFLHISREELEGIKKTYEPVIKEIIEFNTDSEFLSHIEQFKVN